MVDFKQSVAEYVATNVLTISYVEVTADNVMNMFDMDGVVSELHNQNIYKPEDIEKVNIEELSIILSNHQK